MQKYKTLILTDHSTHTKENALYDLAVKMHLHPKTALVDIVSKGIDVNQDFFSSVANAALHATRIDEFFRYSQEGHPLDVNYRKVESNDYDLVWLRLPPPLGTDLLEAISNRFHAQVIINDPKGIAIAGSKEFLINFQDVCPPMKICTSVSDITDFSQLFPIVLKPLRGYGGKGIIKIAGKRVWCANQEMDYEDFCNTLPKHFRYLAVKYLKNVHQGDKRIIVVNGESLGASLRLPAKDSWICNVAMGGSSHSTRITEEERAIVERVNPRLSRLGIVMYGIDTLVDDDGTRVLSELNTTSIGGLPQIARLNQQALVERAIDQIWSYYELKIKTKE